MSISDPVNEVFQFHIMALAAFVANPRRTEIGSLKGESLCLYAQEMKVRYIRTGEYNGPDMTIGKVYEVIGIEADNYRILDDQYMPYLYDPEQFEIVETHEPDFWVTEYGNEGERYSYPETWRHAGYFEDFHDDVESVKKHFWSMHRELYG